MKETQSQSNWRHTVTIKWTTRWCPHCIWSCCSVNASLVADPRLVLWRSVIWFALHTLLSVLVCTVGMHSCVCWHASVCTFVHFCIVTWLGLLVLCFQHSTKFWGDSEVYFDVVSDAYSQVSSEVYLKLISEVGSEVDSESFVCVWVCFCFRHGYCVWGICLIVVGASNRRKCLTWITMQSA